MDLMRAALASVTLCLAACGGGGGGTTTSQSTSPVNVGGTNSPPPLATTQQNEDQNDLPFVIVASGDANMLGDNIDNTGDFVRNTEVQVFVDGNFVTSQTNADPYGDSQSATQNLAHWFGQRVHEETGMPVRILFYAREDSLLEWWLDGETPEGINIREVHEGIIEQGFQSRDISDHDLTNIDVLLWHQGERNSDLELYPSNQYFRPNLLSVFEAYRENDWMDDNTPILVGELAEPGQVRNNGRSGTSSNQNRVLSNFRGEDNIWTVDLKNLPTDSSRQNFTGSSLQTAGYERFWDAWVRANDPDERSGNIEGGQGDGAIDDPDGNEGESSDGGTGVDQSGGLAEGEQTSDHSHPTIVNIPAPFSTIARSFDRKGVNATELNRDSRKANNLNSAFRIRCGVARTERLDPVLARGPMDAMSHMHTFFGSDVELNKNTDNDDLVANGAGSTCAGGRLNRSLYWMPTMLRPSGADVYEPIMPSSFLAYYKTELNVYGKHDDVLFQQNTGTPDRTLILRAMPESIPREWFDLRMIAHFVNSGDVVDRRNDAQWTCTSRTGGVISSKDGIPDCGPGRLNLQFWFPQCLNLKKQPKGALANDPGNYTRSGQDPWLRYALDRTEPNGCPKNDSENEWVRIPTLSFAVSFDVDSRGTRDWRLSSDLMAGDVTPGSTIHGDFVNGWDEETADAWYESCILDVESCTNYYKRVSANRWLRLDGENADLFTNSN